MRYKRIKKILLFWCLFIGIAAVYGSICMLIDPTGKLLQMNEMLPYFQVLPFSDILFQNYIFSGICLLTVNGISNLVAVYLIIKNRNNIRNSIWIHTYALDYNSIYHFSNEYNVNNILRFWNNATNSRLYYACILHARKFQI